MIGELLKNALIEKAVGNNRDNQYEDVYRVKKSLSATGHFDENSEPEPHGYITRAMDQGIRAFQKERGLRVDGYLLPGGETERELLKENQNKGFSLYIPISEKVSSGVDATGRRIRDDIIPTPKQKPEVSSAERKRAILNPDYDYNDFSLSSNPEASEKKPIHALDIFSEVQKNKNTIEDEALKYGVDPDFVKAIIHLETTQGWYDGLYSKFNLNKSIRPMNVRAEYWKSLGYGREDLKDTQKNIKAGILLLRRIQDKMPDAGVAKWATMYNNLGSRKVSDYGARVESLYKEKPWNKR